MIKPDNESFVEDENEIKIEGTSIYLNHIKNEPFEENTFKESFHKGKIKDNLFGLTDNNVIIDNTAMELKAIKEEEESFNTLYCSKCGADYRGYCLKCSSLSRILNSNASLLKSESNTIPGDILEIRETSTGKRVYLRRTLPVNVIFGPFEGILGIESTNGHSWKFIDNKLANIESGNWMKSIACAASASFKNIDIFQINGNLYFQTNREITEGEELLIYYNNEELRLLDNSDEFLYIPRKEEKLPKIFACTMCCLGFGSNECLIEHKRKFCQMKDVRDTEDFVLIECDYCKVWLEKWEHDEYHVAYCSERHQRMRNNYLEAVGRSETDDEGIEDSSGTNDDQGTFQPDNTSTQPDRRDKLPFVLLNGYGCFPRTNPEIHLSDYILMERLRNEHSQNKKNYNCLKCTYQTKYKGHFQRHSNKHKALKLCECSICLAKFTIKDNLKKHMKHTHPENVSEAEYQCSKCSYKTNAKYCFQLHVNTHKANIFQCDVCKMEFIEERCLKTHVKNRHANDGSVKDYKCLECPFRTNYKQSLQYHINRHICIIKQFQCDICKVMFTTKGNRNEHIKNKHKNIGSTIVFES